jgi:hypothetical protein
MPSSIADIRSAVADALKAAFLTGKPNADQWQVSAYMLAQPSLRSIDVSPTGVAYDLAMGGGLDRVSLRVRAMVPSTSDIGQQDLIDTMIDPGSANSMKRALEADRSLGGKVSDIHVISASEYKLYDVQGATPWLGIEWDVEVYP